MNAENNFFRPEPAGKHSWYRLIQALLTGLFCLAAAVFVIAMILKGSLPDASQINKELLNEPLQTNISRANFSFDYKGETYEVKPVASYDLKGLIVSRNNPLGMMDYYHDRTSVDTRDLGVIWGDNLKNNDFHRVKYWNTSWTVNWKFPAGVTFRGDQISNNHIITSNTDVREAIGNINVGDQVQLKGMLVNYRAKSNPESWRKTSTSRADTRNGACEVFFVEKVSVLKAGTPTWYAVYNVARWLLIGLLLLKIAAVVINIQQKTPC